MKIALNIIAPLALIVLALLLAVRGFIPDNAEAVGGQATTISAATTSAAISVTSSTRVLATTTNVLGNGSSYTRVYASICNPSPNLVYLNLDGDKAAAQASGAFTVVIGATSTAPICYEMKDFAQYSGSITASSTNQTATTVYVKDYVN